MARRLKLKTELKLSETNSGMEQKKRSINYEDTAEGVAEGIERALVEVEESVAGKRKLKTLEQLLDENRD
jgi:hypothetical protein